MTKLYMPFAAVVVLGLSTSPLLAQEAMDADGDGLLSYAEMLVAMPDLSEDVFLQMDVNEDGAIDADELAAAREVGLIPAE